MILADRTFSKYVAKYHLLGSSLPVDNMPPKFAQLYIYDTDNEIQNRMSTLTFDDPSRFITESILQKLINMFD